MSVQLTAREEALLKEILEHRFPNGCSDTEYWNNRFYNPPLPHDEETLLRGTFGKLKQKGMINTLWASNIPCRIDVLADGLTYFEDKEMIAEVKDKPTIFVSYQQASGSAFVDDLEELLDGKAEIQRDKHLDAWGDLSRFMESIRDQDFAVMVITDEYLKSPACMVEVTHFMRERDWADRVMFAVLDGRIYKNTSKYRRYWEERQKKLNERRKSDDISIAEVQEIADEMAKIQKFSAELNDFFDVLCNKKNPRVWRIIPDIIKRIETAIPEVPVQEVSSELRKLTEQERLKQFLSTAAKKLLVNAARNRQQIVCIQDLSGWTIGVNGDPNSRVTDEVQIANLREAIEQLETLALIRANSNQRQMFSVTAEGYRVFPDMEIALLLE